MPATKPAPLTVQVMLLMAIVSLPLVRSPPDTTVSVMLLPVLVLPLAVMVIAPSVAAMLGVVSGSELGNDCVEVLSESLAVADTVAETVTLLVAVAAPSVACVAARATAASPSSESLIFDIDVSPRE